MKKHTSTSSLSILFIMVALVLGVSLNAQVCFTPAVNYTAGTQPFSVTSADFNSDGKADLATANHGSDSISVLFGNGAGSFANAVNFAVVSGPYSLTSADFNSDGKADLAVANNYNDSVSVLLGNGAGSFAAAVCFGIGYAAFYVTTADFNSDGNVDIATVNNSTNDVSILLGTGTGSFAPQANFWVGLQPTSLIISDFNADGKADLAVTNSGNNSVSVLIGDGTGSFATAAINFAAGLFPIFVTSADFNTDGKADLAITNYGRDSISVLFGNGTGSFAPAINFAVDSIPSSLITSDFNADGKADLVVAYSYSNSISVLLGNGVGCFAAALSFMVGTNPQTIISADFNADGKADLATANLYNNVSVLLNGTPSITTNATATVVCAGTSVILTGGGAATYTWSGGVSNGVAFIPPTGSTAYTVTGTDTVGCSNSQTVSITVDNTCADVWPGDANSDGLADNLDVLELGLHYTQTGAARVSISNLWQSYYSANWAGTITNGKNLNHNNCNGDGVINDDDTLAIFNNYSSTHAFKTEQVTTNPLLSIVPDQAMVTKGTWGTASINLGGVSNSISNINGIAYTVNYDNTLLETDSVWIDYPTSFINATNQNLKFRKRDFTNGKLYTATTHTINGNVSGFGKIATLHYKIKSTLTTDNVLSLSLTQVNQSDVSGVITPLTAGSGTLMAIGVSVGINEITNGNSISIYPNPANEILTIECNLLKGTGEFKLTDVLGNIVIHPSALNSQNNTVIDVSNLSNGIYFVNVKSIEGIIIKKIVINR